jgi:predicted enzyme related to lactoylglutathione lyase
MGAIVGDARLAANQFRIDHSFVAAHARRPVKMRRVNTEFAEHAEKSLGFFSAASAVSAFNVIHSQALRRRLRRKRMIKGIKFASVPVRDQDKALEFYTTKLGFKVVTDSPFDGKQRWIELGMPRAETKLVLFTADGQEKMIGGFMNVTFMAEDVEATAKEMKARGVEFVQEPQKADWGTAAIFKDVDGNQFVLSTP